MSSPTTADALAWFDQAPLALAQLGPDRLVARFNAAALRQLEADLAAPPTARTWAVTAQLPPGAGVHPVAAPDEALAQLRVAVDLGNVATWRHELATDIVWLDAKASIVLGFSPPGGCLTAEQLRQLQHPDDRAATDAAAQTALRSNQPVDSVVRYRRADDSWRSVMLRRTVQRGAEGQPLAFVGTAMDVTDQLERDRREQELIERFDLVRRSVGFGTWHLDLHTGHADWDEQMWALRGRPAPQGSVTDAARDACVHPDDRERVASKIAEAMQSGQPFEHEFRVILPSGEERWLASRSMELRDDSTGSRRRFGVNWDITDSRMAAAARRQQEMAEGEMHAKSQFLSRMSHELRTPLNAVLGFTELLLARERAQRARAAEGTAPAETDPPSDSSESALRVSQIKHIRSAGKHLLALINDVLELTSVEGGEVRIERRAVPLAAMLKETIALLEPVHRAAGVTLQMGPVEGSVHADPRRLRQVLLNLLSNAVKYNRRGGRVCVEVERSGQQRTIRVSDNGRGMSPGQLQQLFEPFNRLGRDDGTVEGSGIGMAIAKALLERMDGSVQVQSEEGVGSCFEIRLADGPDVPGAEAADAQDGATDFAGLSAAQPAAASASAALPSADLDAAEPAPGPPQRRVLYIEDNPVNALIITELLARRADLALTVAVDGHSGVCDARRLRPDLILLDMQLPDFDGFEVLRRLQADPGTARIPCVALSANAMPEDIQRALTAGITDYWTKPLDFKRFMAALDGLFSAGD